MQLHCMGKYRCEEQGMSVAIQRHSFYNTHLVSAVHSRVLLIYAPFFLLKILTTTHD